MFLLSFCPLILTFIGGSCLQQCYSGILMVIFLFIHPIYIYELEFFCKEDLSSHIYFFIIIHLYQHGLMDIYFIVDKIVTALALRSSHGGFCVLLCAFIFFFKSTFLLSDPTRCSRLIFYFPYLSPHFSKEP